MLVNPKKKKAKRKTAKRKTARAVTVTVNPKRKRSITERATTAGKKFVRRVARRSASPKRLTVQNAIQTTVMPAAVGAAGSVGVDILLGYMPLQANLKTGPVKHLVKGAAAIGLGMLVDRMGIKAINGRDVAVGAITVALAGAMRDAVQVAAPNLKLGGNDDQLFAYDDTQLFGNDDMGSYLTDDSMGSYLTDDTMDGIDYYGSGMVVDGFDDLEGVGEDEVYL